MRMRWLGVCCLWLAAMNAQANDASVFLEKMSEAAHSINYTGTFVHLRHGELMTMTVEHAVNEQGVWELLSSVDGEARQMLRYEGGLTTVFPNKRVVTTTDGEIPSPLVVVKHGRLSDLVKHYDFALVGDARIAGFESRVILATPKDKLRYAYRFFIDKNSSLMLRVDMLNNQRALVEQLLFTDLKIEQRPIQGAFNALSYPADFTVLDFSTDQLDDEMLSHWSVDDLPAGFQIVQALQKKGQSGLVVNHVMFSDGLSMLSVFIAKSPKGNVLKGAGHRGSSHAYGRFLGDYHITVIGDVPAKTVEQVANSVVHLP